MVEDDVAMVLLNVCRCPYTFLCPAGYLTSDDMAYKPSKSYSTIGGLQFKHITYILAHFRLCGLVQNNLRLIRGYDEVRDVSVHGVETIVYTH